MQMISITTFFQTLFCILYFAQSFTTIKPAYKLVHQPFYRKMELSMSGKMSKFGVFSPAVYAGKWILGDAKLNKIRGKAISLHSQAITEWCLLYGAYNLRLKLIKTAKKNGDTLGFLV